MIILIPSANSLKEYLEEEKKTPEPGFCPRCTGKLWRHGKRFRVGESLKLCSVLEIQRALCSPCRKTFSLLPRFLETGKRFERAVRENYVAEFESGEKTYREVAWSEEDADREDAAASVSRTFRAVQEAVEVATELTLEAQGQLIESQTELQKDLGTTDTTQAEARAKSACKRDLLKTLRYLFVLLNQIFCNGSSPICHAYRALNLGFRLPTPHSMQQAPF